MLLLAIPASPRGGEGVGEVGEREEEGGKADKKGVSVGREEGEGKKGGRAEEKG